VLACSPRSGGNSDTAADLFARGYASAAGQSPQPVLLREYTVLPCIGCDACRRAIRHLPPESQPESHAKPHARLKALFGQTCDGLPRLGCPLAAGDHGAPLLNFLAEAPALCLVSPIYFYHLPALLKALLDRTQPFWNLRDMGIDVFRVRERTCHVILLGARPQGKQLFEGSLLTLKYALAGLHIKLAEPLLLYGLEQPSALAGDSRTGERVFQYGRQAAGGPC
jgi:multimeric flavodoxin WrbA